MSKTTESYASHRDQAVAAINLLMIDTMDTVFLAEVRGEVQFCSKNREAAYAFASGYNRTGDPQVGSVCYVLHLECEMDHEEIDE
jgi:hypothetical protein